MRNVKIVEKKNRAVDVNFGDLQIGELFQSPNTRTVFVKIKTDAATELGSLSRTEATREWLVKRIRATLKYRII